MPSKTWSGSGAKTRVGLPAEFPERADFPHGGLLEPKGQAHAKSRLAESERSNFRARLQEAGLSADTVARSATNLLTFNQADKGEAALEAFFEPGGLKNYRQRYQAALAQQDLRDRYDSLHRRKAQLTGDVIGAGLGFGLTGGASTVEGAAPWLRAAPRIAGAAKLSGRELAAIIGSGGLAGYGSQKLSDTLSGHSSTLGDQGGAIVGGMAGAVALPLGAARAGAVDASVTSAAQDLFNRRPVSLEQALQNSVVGHAFGGVGGNIAGRWSDQLSMEAKGKLGETLGVLRRRLNGYRRTGGPKKSRDYLENSKKYWMPDDRSGDIRFEYKFGRSNNLSNNQKIAQKQLENNFMLYHFTPSDLAKAAGFTTGSLSPFMTGEARGRHL